MKQKFRKLTFIKTTDTCHGQFPRGFKGIVDGTYSQIYGGKNITSYGIFRLDFQLEGSHLWVGNKIIDRHAWIEERHITALKRQNRRRAEEMIEEYNLGR